MFLHDSHKLLRNNFIINNFHLKQTWLNDYTQTPPYINV